MEAGHRSGAVIRGGKFENEPRSCSDLVFGWYGLRTVHISVIYHLMKPRDACLDFEASVPTRESAVFLLVVSHVEDADRASSRGSPIRFPTSS